MTLFVFSSWFFCIITSISLAILLWRYRFLFVKPSIIVILLFHLQIQWAATVYSGYIESYLPYPIPFAILTHCFPLIGLVISYLTTRKSALIIWDRITDPHYQLFRSSNRAIFLLLGYIVVVTIWYLSYVPLSKTGLFSILFDPMHSAQAREESLKLLYNVPLKYAYSFLGSIFAPLLAIMLALFLVYNVKQKRIIRVTIDIIVLVCIFVIASLTGARGPVAKVILSIILAFYLNQRMPIRPFYIILAAVAVLFLPVVFSILREGQEFSLLHFVQYLTGGIFRRVFVAPMFTGLWHTHYAQTSGFFGIGGIPKLAVIFGVAPFSAANIIYLNYTSYSLQSGLANTCYVLSYYSYFGLISFVFSLLGLWFLDFAVLIYRQLSNRVLLPCVASVSVASISFISSDYTTVLLTHGFGLLLIIALVLDYICRFRIWSPVK